MFELLLLCIPVQCAFASLCGQGSFGGALEGGEDDVRFVYCAGGPHKLALIQHSGKQRMSATRNIGAVAPLLFAITHLGAPGLRRR